MKHTGSKRIQPVRYMIYRTNIWRDLDGYNRYWTFRTFEEYFFRWFRYYDPYGSPALVEALDIHSGELRIYKCTASRGFRIRGECCYEQLTPDEVMLELL